MKKRLLVKIVLVAMIVAMFLSFSSAYLPAQDLTPMPRYFRTAEGQRLLSVFHDRIEELADWYAGRTIYRIVELSDFAENTYTLVELYPLGYMIYHNESGVFVEVAGGAPSPYAGLYGDLFYGGFMNYFHYEDGYFRHTIEENVFAENVVEEYNWSEYSEEIAERLIEEYVDVGVLAYVEHGFMPIQPLGNNVFTRIRNCYVIFGQSQLATTNSNCAYVALAIVIGYLDYRHPTRIILPPNTNSFVNRTRKYPRVLNAFAEHLVGLGAARGYGRSIGAFQTRNVARDFFSSRGLNSVSDDTLATSTVITNARINNHIRGNRPVILAARGLPGTPAGATLGHAVVAYAYRGNNNGTFTYIVNYGWGAGTINVNGTHFPRMSAQLTGVVWEMMVAFTMQHYNA